jgi:spore germination cell wall hydrolase CwlJ-like protein
LRSGEGARLVQPTSPRRRASSTPRTTAETRPVDGPSVAARGASTTLASDADYRSSIVPPAYTGAGITSAPGRRYTPPRLDLKTPPRIPTSDIECLTQAVYYEARNESEDGQAAVAEVVVNRSRSGAYPRSICAVVYQRNSRTCQFTFTCDGAIGRSPVDMRKWARAEQIARRVHEGRSATLLPTNSVNYHANYVRPSWGARLERVRQIGAHIFYGAVRGRGSTPGASEPAQTAPVPARGLIFTRIEALDRAYQAVTSAQASDAADSSASQGRQ